MCSPARFVAVAGGRWQGGSVPPGNKSGFVDTTDRRRTLVASRCAGTCSSLPLAIDHVAVNLSAFDLDQATRFQ